MPDEKKRKKTPREKRPFSFNLDIPRSMLKRKLREQAGTPSSEDLADMPKQMKTLARRLGDEQLAKFHKAFNKKKRGGKRPKNEPKMTK